VQETARVEPVVRVAPPPRARQIPNQLVQDARSQSEGQEQAPAMKALDMRYRVGDTVFCPPHGRALVEAVEARRVNGEERTFLVLRAAEPPDLVVHVPIQNLDRRGIEAMPPPEEPEQVLAILRSKSAKPPTIPWAQQCRDNAQALASGDVLEVARVLRDVWLRGCAQPLTRSEKRMLVRARQTLVTRLSLCLEETTPTKVEQLIEDALASS